MLYQRELTDEEDPIGHQKNLFANSRNRVLIKFST